MGKGGQEEYDTITEDNITIIEANKTNIITINNILNNIYNTEKIADQWQKGEIIIFYKGKGKK